MFNLAEPPLFRRLRDARRVLIAGAGGGFDVYAGLPLAIALDGLGKEVHLANHSFSDLTHLVDPSGPNVARVEPATTGNDAYFPERTLARWLAGTHLAPTVYAFPRSGVRPLRAAYRWLIAELDLDAVILVDGGTDILMRGDEAGLGTPEEDMASLAAVAGIDGINRLVVCLGFGIDAHHGVSHAQVLENLADLGQNGAYLGALSIPSDSAEARAYVEAVEHAQRMTPLRPSIVNGQIAAALRGEFGDAQFTSRTGGSELFVNPLMSVYFSVDLPGLANRLGYLDRIEETDHPQEISKVIEAYREQVPIRPGRALPH
ncbi:DUF1152 domain-containing protein [Kribbella sp. NBC_01245]|uniref:DUF1152 domain-containing protein n=1 Tax=Kribbella sp. NBC_01245 TaxID=2903578 RepID=UPI002E27CAD5|nr:DUF1152 domain-containing protein [Kribbella sp. NBC_01245]